MTDTTTPSNALTAKVQELLAEQISGGKLDDLIRKKLADLIDSLLTDQLRPYSSLGQALEEQLSQALNVNLRELGLGGYNLLVAEVVRSHLDTQLKGQWAEQLKQQVDSMLRGAPAEIKLSELFVQFAEGWTEHAQNEEWAHATMHVGASEYRSTWVYLDPEPHDDEREHWRFMWRMLIDDKGELRDAEQYQAAARSKLGTLGAERRKLFTTHHGFEGLLFQLRAGKTKIIIDRKPGLHEHDYPEKECEC